jgi:methionyl aminopeptidase
VSNPKPKIEIKTAEEIEKIRQACRIVAQVLFEVERVVKPGISTAEIDIFAEGLIRKNGAEPAFKGYRGYPASTCISINEIVVHGIPDAARLKEGDIVGVDIGTRFRGYYGDMSRTFPVGQVSDSVERLLKATQECLTFAISTAKAGKHVGDISFAIESCAKKYGYQVVRDLYGHGIGRSLHEEPLIPNYGEAGSGPKLKAGMVMAIEPMLNLGGYEIETMSDGWSVKTKDRSLSAHFENTILITDGDAEILTKV